MTTDSAYVAPYDGIYDLARRKTTTEAKRAIDSKLASATSVKLAREVYLAFNP